MTDALVLTIDGPSGSGKGTIAQLMAKELGWHYLDSGCIYRALAQAAILHKIKLDDVKALSSLADALDIVFLLRGDRLVVLLEGKDVSDLIRTEYTGNAASQVAVHYAVRVALLRRQQDFYQMPGLVTDGRDMGTVVFPYATYKVFLTASVKKRAQRRYMQLKKRGIKSNLSEIAAKIFERDVRDSKRIVAPLQSAIDALIIDSTDMGIDAVFERVRAHCSGI